MRDAIPLGVLAFAAGLFVADAVAAADGPLVVAAREFAALVLVTLAGALLAGSRTRGLLLLLAAFLLGAGILTHALEEAEVPMSEGVVSVIVDGRVAARALRSGRLALTADRVRAVTGARLPSRLELWVEPESPLAAFPVGTRFRAAVELRPPRGVVNPGGPDRARRLARRGVGAVGRLRHPAFVVATGSRGVAEAARASLDRGRERSAARLRARGPGGALLAALALGDRSGLDPAVSEAAARGGVAHLLAVSGLHLALVSGAAVLLASLVLGRPLLLVRMDVRRLAWGAGLGAGLAYAVASGLPISMQRAVAFLAVLAFAVSLRRPVTPRQRLALAAGLVLVLEPAALFEAGAQLSFVATAALIAAPGSGDANALPSLRERAVDLLRASAAASLATAPIAAWHFGTASSFGWLANLVAIPVTGLLLLPLALASAAIEALELRSLGLLVDVAVKLGEACLAATRGWAELVPLAGSARPGWTGFWIASAVAAIGLTRRSLRARALAAMLCGGILAQAPPDPIAPATPRVVFLDVGWGDAIVVQGDEAAILVDSGGAFEGFDAGRSIVLPALARLGIRRLDAFAITHRDRDHSGGARSVLGGIPVDALWLPFGGAADPALAEVRETARRHGIPIRELGTGSAPWRRGRLAVEALWPPPASTKGGNAESLVLRVSAGGTRFLLMGDLEAEGERQLLRSSEELAADVLKLGHHGSRTSSGRAFLEAVGPAWAIVSAPAAGRLGFPHPSVLERATSLAIDVAWTGRDGAVLIAPDADSRRYTVRCWSKGQCSRTKRE